MLDEVLAYEVDQIKVVDPEDTSDLDIVEGKEQDITDQCIQKERILKLHVFLREVLSPLEYEVIKYRYGLFGEKELTQRVLGKRLGISRSYVSRIEKNAVLKLRDRFFSA